MDLSAGDRVDRFELIEQLGSGGQGAVWKARDPLQPDRLRALKLVSLAGTLDSSLERLRREARALAQLEHPSLVRCDGVFEDLRRDVLGLVMDFVEGHSLKSLVGDARLTARPVSLALRHLAEALAYLHGRRIVHRDLKLENVVVDQRFFEEPERAEHIKLVDFGIAISSDAASRLTMVGGVVGTPPYLAPELLDPATFAGDQIAPAVDIFAFGVLATLLYAGQHPSGLSPGAGVFQYAESYRSAARGEREFPLHLPSGGIGDVIRDCLAVRAADRIGDGRELALRLRSTDASAVPVSKALPDSPTAVASPVAMQGDTELADRAPAPAQQPPPARDADQSRTQASATQPSRGSSLGPAAVSVVRPELPSARTTPSPEAATAPRRGGLWIGLSIFGVALAAAAVWFLPPLFAPPPPQALPDPTPLPTLSAPLPPVMELDAGADADAGEGGSVLPDGCAELCDCCPSGVGCGPGGCDERFSASDRFVARVADVDLPDGSPAVTTCLRLAREGAPWQCDESLGLPISLTELTMFGIEISTRLEGDAAVLWSEGGQFDAGLTREVLCRGVEVKPSGGTLPGTRYRLYLDPPGTQLPARCLPAD